MSGALYKFNSRKARSLDNGTVEADCNPVKPNIRVLADGQRYDILMGIGEKVGELS
jgi:hypothetical protein